MKKLLKRCLDETLEMFDLLIPSMVAIVINGFIFGILLTLVYKIFTFFVGGK